MALSTPFLASTTNNYSNCNITAQINLQGKLLVQGPARQRKKILSLLNPNGKIMKDRQVDIWLICIIMTLNAQVEYINLWEFQWLPQSVGIWECWFL